MVKQFPIHHILFSQLSWDNIDKKPCVSLRYITGWFSVLVRIHCEMVITIRLFNTCITSHGYLLCVCVGWQHFRSTFLATFKYITQWLTIVPMVYIRFPPVPLESQSCWVGPRLWGCFGVCSGVCNWRACYQGLRHMWVLSGPWWMGLLPGCSVGWHWEKGTLQGPQLGTQIVGSLSSARVGVAPTRALGETC